MFTKSSKLSIIALTLALPVVLTGCTSANPIAKPTPTAPIPTITVTPQETQQVVQKLDEVMLYIDSSIATMNDLGISEIGKVGENGYKTVITKYNGKLTSVTYYTEQNAYTVYTEEKFTDAVIIYSLRNMLKSGFDVTMSSEGIYHAVKNGTSEEYWIYVQDGKIMGIEGTNSEGVPITVQIKYGLSDADKALFNAGVENQKASTGTETGKDTIPQ